MKVKDTTKITVPAKATIRVVWEDEPENYTKEKERRIKSYFTKKYGVSKVNVVFRGVKDGDDDKKIQMSVSDDVLDPNYHRKLFKEWLGKSVKQEVIDEVWDGLLRLDDKVNDKLSQSNKQGSRNRKWSLDKLELDNFLSFGDGNVLPYSKLNGVVAVSSSPKNQGGKTISSLDAPLFLFFNKTTKTKKNDEIFNKFRDDTNKVKVRGFLTIDDEKYIIERSLTRKLKKKGDGYTVKAELNYSRIMPDGSVINLEGEQRAETDKIITDTIGNEKDFLLTIIATSNNLEDLIDTKATERGKILTRFIGLEVFEEKETIGKGIKSDWEKGLKSNIYNVKDLEQSIDELNQENLELSEEKGNITSKLELKEEEITATKDIREGLLTQKIDIDPALSRLNPNTIQEEIERNENKKVGVDIELKGVKTKIKEFGKVEYDEDEYNELVTKEKEISVEMAGMKSDIKHIEKLIDNLKNGEICQTCNRKLDDINNSDAIKDNEDELEQLKLSFVESDMVLGIYVDDLALCKGKKTKSEALDKLNLKISKLELDKERIDLDIKGKEGELKKYNDNLSNFEKNKELDVKLLGYKSKLEGLEIDRDNFKSRIRDIDNEVKNNIKTIDSNKDIIETINKEEKIGRVFKIYLDLVGKKGISKMVMRSVIPMINGEISRLLSDAVPFRVELDINDKHDVEFILETPDKNGELVRNLLSAGSGFEKTMGALALRCILSKVSTLPTPSMIVLDEVFGKVANENLEHVGNMMIKLKDLFNQVIIISHNEMISDWADNIINISKVNNVSSLKIT